FRSHSITTAERQNGRTAEDRERQGERPWQNGGTAGAAGLRRAEQREAGLQTEVSAWRCGEGGVVRDVLGRARVFQHFVDFGEDALVVPDLFAAFDHAALLDDVA